MAARGKRVGAGLLRFGVIPGLARRFPFPQNPKGRIVTGKKEPTFTIAEDGSHVIPLEKPMTGHQGQFSELRMRPPTFKDFMEFGDPTTLIVSSGAMIPQDDFNIIKAYIVRLSGVDELILAPATIRDARAMRDAVKDFF